MTATELELYFLTFQNDPSENNHQSLMQAVYEIARALLSVHDLGEAKEDVLQEVVLSVWKELPKLPPDTPFAYWLMRLVYNRRMDYYRSQTRASERNREREITEETLALYEPTYTFNHSRLREVSGDSYPLILDLLADYSWDEVAKRHGLTKKAVQQRLYRLRQKHAAFGKVN